MNLQSEGGKESPFKGLRTDVRGKESGGRGGGEDEAGGRRNVKWCTLVNIYSGGRQDHIYKGVRTSMQPTRQYPKTKISPVHPNPVILRGTNYDSFQYLYLLC